MRHNDHITLGDWPHPLVAQVGDTRVSVGTSDVATELHVGVEGGGERVSERAQEDVEDCLGGKFDNSESLGADPGGQIVLLDALVLPVRLPHRLSTRHHVFKVRDPRFDHMAVLCGDRWSANVMKVTLRGVAFRRQASFHRPTLNCTTIDKMRGTQCRRIAVP